MKKISVITPVYFNAGSLRAHVESVKQQREVLMKEFDVDVELIYVNDGSGDNSYEILRQIQSDHSDWVALVNLSRNFGSLQAIKAGFSRASGDCATYLSADLQDPASLLPRMVEKWLGGHDYVICVRKDRKDPLTSKLFAKFFYFLSQKMILNTYPAKGFDVFLLSKKYMHYIQRSGKNFNIILFSYWLGLKPAVIKYSRLKREHGKSRWSFRKKVKLVIDSFIGFSTAPLRMVSTAALFVSFSSFFYGLFVLVRALLGHVPVPGYATIVCLISFLLALIILMLCIIAEYIVRIYDQVTGKPEYVVEEEF